MNLTILKGVKPMRMYVALVSFASTAFTSGLVQAAADPEAARHTAVTVCASCHGPKGISPAKMQHPNLAGQKEAYLASSLRAYRDKIRNFPAMNAIAASLKDEEIANLAAYFAKLKPCE
jgi:cytochrome c553